MAFFSAKRSIDMMSSASTILLVYRNGQAVRSSSFEVDLHIIGPNTPEQMLMRGSFSAFAQGKPTSGALFEIVQTEERFNGGSAEVATYGGLGVTVEQFVAFANSSDASGLLTLLYAGDDTITGSAFADVLYGHAGADAIDGGAGVDKMSGGSGDDRYIIDAAEDEVIEAADGGTDTVTSLISYKLSAHVEKLVLSGSGPANGTGNDLANRLEGNGAANMLDGGAGADIMAGGAGDDLFLVDNINDKVVEVALAGTDTVNSSVSHSLAAEVENLNLVGASAVSGTGNAGDNIINGNAAANLLSGGGGKDTLNGGGGNDTLNGGTGADLMRGAAGNDTYIVDNALDKVEETATTGSVDLVRASVSYALETGVRVETLSAFSPAGTATINLTGNQFANTVVGNNGANLLLGKGQNDVLRGNGGADNLQGGAGADRLYGGLGRDVLRGDEIGGTQSIDRFYFDTALNASTNVDTVKDFNPAFDFFHLARSVFKNIGTSLTRDALRIVGVDTPDAEDRIIYNPTTGALFFDADGTGTTFGAIQFALLENKPAAISNADFVMFG